MNKSRETHSPSEDDGARRAHADPWTEFLSESSEELQQTLSEPEASSEVASGAASAANSDLVSGSASGSASGVASGSAPTRPAARLDERLEALASRHVSRIEDEFALESKAPDSLAPLPSWMIGEASRREEASDAPLKAHPAAADTHHHDSLRNDRPSAWETFEVQEPKATPIVASEPLPPPVPFDTTPTVTLANIVARQVPVHWSEAVATIQQLCVVLGERHPAPGIPELADISVTETGDVIVHERVPGAPDMRNLGLLLHSLLSTATTPLPLRLFVTSSTSSQRYGSIEAFADALSLYAATAADRSRLIQALCLRSLEETPAAAMHIMRVDDEPRATRAKRRLPVVAIALAAVVALSCGVGAAYWLRDRMPASASAIPTAPLVAADATAVAQPPAVSAPSTVRSTGSRRLGAGTVARPESVVAAGDVASPLVPMTSGATPTSQPPMVSHQPSVVSQVSPAVPEPPVAHGAPNEVAERPSNLVTTQAPVSNATDSTVYTRADNDVRPPVIRSSLMPPTPAGAGVDRVSNTLELLVDQDGNVQRAHFIRPTQRLIDATAISAAKMMKFSPATKNGRPVPYLLHLPWNSTPD